MEGSGAGLAAAPAAGDAAAAAEGGGDATPAAEQQQNGQQQSQPDVNAQLQSINEMLEPMRDLLQAEPWKPAEETPAETPPDLSFLDDQQPNYTPEQAAKGLQDLVEKLATDRAQALVEPLAKQQQEMQTKQDTDELIARYPQLGDDTVASQVVDTSRQLAAELGHPELASSPRMYELVYLAGRATDQANAETAAGGGAATLEGAGGASPGGSGQGAIPTTQSVTAGWRASSLPLFGTKR